MLRPPMFSPSSSSLLLPVLPRSPHVFTPDAPAVADSNADLEKVVDESGRAPTFAVYTLGCKVNQADTGTIARELAAQGFRLVPFRERADLYVVDTCTVTQEADKKSRKAAARARRNNPDAVVAVTGCAATRDAAQFEAAAPGALVLSNARKSELARLALQRLRARPDWARDYARYRALHGSEPVLSPTRERAILKVQDGCEHRCAFCIIPRMRGRSVLKSHESALQEARELVSEGARELVVTGVSLGDWSRAQGARDNAALCALLRELAELPLERLRVSSIDVADADDEFLQLVATHPKICPHLHLALQSGSRTVLRRMRRRYSPERFLKIAQRWRALRPDGGLTTDVIVGFPGETLDEWKETLDVVRAAKFSSVHVFPYSPREATHAAEHLDDLGGLLSPQEQSRRVDELLELSRELARGYVSQFFGAVLPVMLEGERDLSNAFVGEGLTPQYTAARVEGVPATYTRGDVVMMRARQWRDGALCGEFAM